MYIIDLKPLYGKENSKIYNSLGVVVYYNIISSNTPVRDTVNPVHYQVRSNVKLNAQKYVNLSMIK